MANPTENPRIREIRGIRDPLARAREAQALIDRGRQTIADAQRIRDEAIREARDRGNYTRETLADLVGTTKHIVVTALRRRGKHN